MAYTPSKQLTERWQSELRAAIDAEAQVPPTDTYARLCAEAATMRAIVSRLVWAGGSGKLMCSGYHATLDRADEWLTLTIRNVGKLPREVVERHAAAFGVPSVVWVWSKDGETARATWREFSEGGAG